MDMASIKPAKLAYKRFEPEGGVDDSLCPVIFLHGLTLTKSMWLDMPQVIAGKTKRMAYALDARNHGDSEFTDVFGFEENITDLLHFMDTMNISKAALVGLSQGGITSIQVALHTPERVEMIFSGDMHASKIKREIPDSILASNKIWAAAVESTPLGLSEKDAVKYVVHCAYNEMEKKQKEKRKIPKENFLNGRFRLRSKPDGSYDLCYNKDAINNYLKNYNKNAKENLSGQYNGPAYFIYGSASQFGVAEEEGEIKRLFPEAELIEFEGASHDVVGDCWERFTDIVLTGLKNYKPVKLAYKHFEPVGGADDSLCPVIFLHGVTSSKDAWLDMPQVIADKTKRMAYAIDARNHGESENNDVFDFDVNAVDLIHFMETMNISKAALVGHSMGGMTAMKTALKEPEKVEMFFSVDMHSKKLPKMIGDNILQGKLISIAAVEAIPLGLSEKDAVKFALDWAYNKIEKELNIKPLIKKENLLTGRMRLRSKPDGTYEVYYNKDAVFKFFENYERDYIDLSGQYDGPAFFLYGNASPFNVAEQEEHIQSHFPKAELIEFDGASHDVVGDCWEEFTEAVVTRL